MAFNFNVTKTDLGSYPPYLIMAPRSWGKTTFYKKLIQHLYGDQSKGLLISCGTEKGHKSLNGIQYAWAKWATEDDRENEIDDKLYDIEQAETDKEKKRIQREIDVLNKTARSFTSIVDELVDGYGVDHDIQVVFIDTLDTLTEIYEPEILRIHKKECKDKPAAKSYNSALGGFQNGQKRASQLIREQVDRLNELGIAVFYLAHTKFKSKKDKFSKEEFETYTNSLLPAFYDGIADTCQMVMVGTIEKTVSNKQVEEEHRYLYLLPTSLIEAKSRFTYITDKIECNLDNEAEVFMNAFNDAVRRELEEDGENVDIEKIKKKELEERKEIASISKSSDKNKRNSKIDEEKNVELIEIIKEKFMALEDRDEFKALMAKVGVTNFNNPEEIPTKSLETLKAYFD